MENAEPVVVEPLNPTAPAPPVESTAPAASEFDDELLQIPAMQALFSGQPAALSAPIEQFSKGPEAKILQDHKEELQRAGMGLYRSLDGALGVMFNQMHVSGEKIKEADAAGQLLQVAPDFNEVNAAVAKSGSGNPVLNSAPMPTGAAVAGPAAPMPMVPPPSAGAQKKVAAAREHNMLPSAPTAGANPGQGRLLASILKPVL